MAEGLQEFVEYFKSLTEANDVAKAKAMLATMLFAQKKAKENQSKTFGNRDNKLTGHMLNSIFQNVGVENGEPFGELGTQGIAYGRIHEYGGTIKPVKAKHLWIPQKANTGKLSPKDFISLTKSDAKFYAIAGKIAGVWTGQFKAVTDRSTGRLVKRKVLEPLFILADEAHIPARPYLTPALDEASDSYQDFFIQYLDESTP